MTNGDSQWDAWAQAFAEWSEFLGIDDATAYARLLAGNPGFSVELGCGDGRATEVVLPDYAVDISPRAVALARRRLDGRTAVHVGDAKTYSIPEPASFTFCTQNTLNLFSEDATLREVLKQVFSNTRPGGLFVFDVMNPVPAELRRRNRYLQLRYRNENHVLYTGIVRRSDHEVETIGVWETVDASGVVVERRHLPPINVNLRPVHAYRALISNAGFEIDGLWGDYEGSEFTTDSPIQFWHARRP